MTARKLFLTLAALALSAATTFAAAGPSQAATARPAPSPSPTPTPTPPPHGLNCDDGSNGPGWITGTFYIGASGYTASTSITVLPNTPDARRYMRLTEQQVTAQFQTGPSSPAPSLNLGAAFAQISQQVQNSQAFAHLAQLLQPVTRSTTVDAGGNWACHGLATGTYLMLATLTETPNDVTATAAPKRLYFRNTVVYRQNAKNDVWRIDVPLGTWHQVTPQSL